MKNLKKLIAIWAVMGASYGANAFETVFEPVEKGDAETEGIELVNGQLMVKSKEGRIGDVETPYTFVGTNTTNFASSGFAVKEMADANSVVLDGSDVYFTRTSDTTNVYHLAVSNNQALNGVSGKLEKIASNEPISGVLAVKDGIVYSKNATGDNVVEVGGDSTSVPSVTLPESAANNLHFVNKDGNVYVYEKNGDFTQIVKYNKDGERTSDSWGGWVGAVQHQDAKEMVVFDKFNSFILRKDGVIFRDTNVFYPKKDISSEEIDEVVLGIKAGKDGKLLITSKNSNGKIMVSSYDTGMKTVTSVYSEVTGKKPFVKKEVESNSLNYYVTGKKIGYSIAD